MFFVGCISFLISIISEIIGNSDKKLTKHEFIKAFLIAIFMVYCYFIIAVTLLIRHPSNVPRAKWMPLWSWIKIIEGDKPILHFQEICLNVFLFIPYGTLLELNWKMPVVKTLFIGILTSLIIEVVQYVTYLGAFEWDDIIHNSLGCLIGAWVVKLIMKKHSE